jgi:hypothetical protein
MRASASVLASASSHNRELQQANCPINSERPNDAVLGYSFHEEFLDSPSTNAS